MLLIILFVLIVLVSFIIMIMLIILLDVITVLLLINVLRRLISLILYSFFRLSCFAGVFWCLWFVICRLAICKKIRKIRMKFSKIILKRLHLRLLTFLMLDFEIKSRNVKVGLWYNFHLLFFRFSYEKRENNYQNIFHNSLYNNQTQYHLRFSSNQKLQQKSKCKWKEHVTQISKWNTQKKHRKISENSFTSIFGLVLIVSGPKICLWSMWVSAITLRSTSESLVKSPVFLENSVTAQRHQKNVRSDLESWFQRYHINDGDTKWHTRFEVGCRRFSRVYVKMERAEISSCPMISNLSDDFRYGVKFSPHTV